MKKLYRKGTVHPSPPIISDHLAFLPATILTLAAVLTEEDREVLAYLISCSNTNNNLIASFSNFSGQARGKATAQKSSTNSGNKATAPAATGGGGADHPPLFNCDCFRCYTSYWVRWDTSPNRQVIHEIIDAYEDGLEKNFYNKGGKNISRKERRKRNSNNMGGSDHDELMKSSDMGSGKGDSVRVDSAGGGDGGGDDVGGGGGGEGAKEFMERGSVRKFVSFLGERIWGAWN